MKKQIITIGLFLLCVPVFAQPMTLQEAIDQARTASVDAVRARQAFVSTYWTWRSYRASLLPSFSIYGNLGNFNRSLALLQLPDDGTMRYVNTNNLQNSIGLRISQNITFTGGTISIYSDLNRIDQFGLSKAVTWYAQPITISFNQPLFAYNSFKWDRKIQPKEYEKGRREYLTALEQVVENTVEAYFRLLLTHQQWMTARSNYADSGSLLKVAMERSRLGTGSRDEYLQLELQLLNDSLSVNQKKIAVREAQMALNSLLSLSEVQEVEPVFDELLPALIMDYEQVVDKANENAPFQLDNELQLLQAKSSVERAKASRGLSMSLNARFGLSKSGISFPDAYLNPLDQEVVGITFCYPIFDWGESRGKVQKARAAEEVVKAQIRQAESDYRRKLYSVIGEFNNQRNQCVLSKRASEIAAERYILVIERFRLGNATVLELNNARSDKDIAQEQYIQDIGNYWQKYYEIRKETLYDFLLGIDLEIDENELIR